MACRDRRNSPARPGAVNWNTVSGRDNPRQRMLAQCTSSTSSRHAVTDQLLHRHDANTWPP